MLFKVKIEKMIACWTFCLFEIFYFLTRVVRMPGIIANFGIALLGIIGFGLCICFPYKILKSNVILFASVLSCFFLVSNLYTENSDYAEIMWIWAYMGVAMLIINFAIPYWLAGGIYYGVCGYFLGCWIRGVPPQEVITIGSRNSVSAIVIAYMLIYLLILYMQRERIDLFAAIISLIICLWGVGRAGILAMLFMNFCLVVYSLGRKQGKFTLVLYVFLIGIASWGIYRYGKTVVEMTVNRFLQMGVKDVRTKFFQSYLDDCRYICNLLFGVPFQESLVLKDYYNPHNSWLMLHAKFGIVPTIIVIGVLLKKIVWLLKRNKRIYLLIIAVAFLRCSFDWLSFNGLFDVLWWLLILSVIAARRRLEYEN